MSVNVDFKKLPSTPIIHETNHTQTIRSCVINSKHTVGQSIVARLIVTETNNEFSSLNPGLYIANIDGVDYYFDLYIAVGPVDQLKFKSIYDVYAMVGQDKYRILLYKKEGNIPYHKTELKDTVNDFISMIVIDGQTVDMIGGHDDIQEQYAVIPNNKIIPSSDFQRDWNGTLEDLLVDNTVFKGLDYTDSVVYQNEVTAENNKIWDLRSISNFRIVTDKDSIDDIDIDDYLHIILKNNIKSLPNGLKDTFILNAEQQQNHIIYRIGRRVFTGAEDWVHLEDRSNDNYHLFFLAYDNVKLENSANNLSCSHLLPKQGSYLATKSVNEEGIATGYGSFGKGFLLRVSKSTIGYDREDMTKPLQDWLFNELVSEHPFMVEYALEQYIYKTVLLDEYRVKTYFPNTFVTLSGNYDVSYFYKALHTSRR